MKKIVFVLIVTLSVFAFAQSTGSIRGTVKNATSLEPVPAANIVIESLSKGAASDPNGKYIITKIKPGTYTVKVTGLGYKDVLLENIVIKAGETTQLDPLLTTRVPFPDTKPEVWSIYNGELDGKFKKQLDEIKALDTKKYQALLRKTYFNRLRFRGNDPFKIYLSEINDEIMEMELQSEKLALEYKNAKSSEKSAIKEKLNDLLNDLFAKREKLKQNEVDELTKELEELKSSLELRKKKKDTIIERRLEELLGNGEIFDW
ncbi:MAG: hypothetical protein SCALA702_21130 [Melioribacteraceae bacterium]|nr:MAG: hypothetical protein SCALA702_21130 [Melioribacteraceae bacterium]